MLTLGSPNLYLWDDQWTAVTADQRRSAQFEHTLLCHDDEAEILTRTPAGEGAAEVYAKALTYLAAFAGGRMFLPSLGHGTSR